MSRLERPSEADVYGATKAALDAAVAQERVAAGGGEGYGPWRAVVPLGVTEFGGAEGLPVLNGAGLGHEPTESEANSMLNRVDHSGVPGTLDPATGLPLPTPQIVKR